MNFNLVEMYNGLLRFNKHILNELAEGLKHLPNLDGVSKGDSLIINEQGNPAWGSTAFIPTFENAAYGIEWTKDDNDIIRIGNAKFHRELPIQNRLKGCVYNEKKISYFLNPTGWAKPLENGLIPLLDDVVNASRTAEKLSLLVKKVDPHGVARLSLDIGEAFSDDEVMLMRRSMREQGLL
jgi:hypothetical protein